jgi:hypothetical protein
MFGAHRLQNRLDFSNRLTQSIFFPTGDAIGAARILSGAPFLYYNYVLACRDVMQNGSQQWNGWTDLMRAGATPPPSGAPSDLAGLPSCRARCRPGDRASLSRASKTDQG